MSTFVRRRYWLNEHLVDAGNDGVPCPFQVGYIRIDGSVPSSERAQLVRKFQTDPAIRVAVLSIQAAGQVRPPDLSI